MNWLLCRHKIHPDHVVITWLNPEYHVKWPSTVYRTSSVQLHLQGMGPVKQSGIYLLCSKKVKLTISWPLGWMSATLLSENLTLMSAALPPGSMVGTGTGLHQWINTPSLESHVWSNYQCSQTQETLTSRWYEMCDYSYAQKVRGSSLLRSCKDTPLPDSEEMLLGVHSGASVLSSGWLG